MTEPTTPEERVVGAVRHYKGGATVWQTAFYMGIDQDRARRKLNRLVDKGVLTKHREYGPSYYKEVSDGTQ